METVSSNSRIASTAAASAPSLSPRPIQRAQASAAYSVVRTSSIARLRSGLDAPDSMSRTLYDARRLARGLVDGLAQIARGEQAQRRQETHEIANPETDIDAVSGAPEDDPVTEDQHERNDPNDHRHLPRLPGQRVPARDDPGEDERRGAGRHEQPVEHAEHLPSAAAVAARRATRQLGVRVVRA